MAGYVTRRTLTVVVLALLSVTAISMGAATIGSTVSLSDTDPVIRPPGGGQNNTIPGDRGGGEGDPLGNRTDDSAGLQFETCVPFLTSLPGTGLYFVAFFGLLYVIKRRYSFGSALLASYGLAPLVFLAYFMVTSDCASAGGPGVGSGNAGGGGVPGSGTAFSPPEFSPIVLLGVLGVVLVAMAAVLFSASGDQVIAEDEEEEEDASETDVADFAAAAGEAADRLEAANADVDNEVYRAWWEMTNLLDVADAASTTPGEFADAAVELGIDREDVDELTELFEEVRYGRRDPASREERAIEVFRRIESEYGSERAVEFDTDETMDDANDTDANSSDTDDTDATSSEEHTEDEREDGSENTGGA